MWTRMGITRTFSSPFQGCPDVPLVKGCACDERGTQVRIGKGLGYTHQEAPRDRAPWRIDSKEGCSTRGSFHPRTYSA